MKVRYIAVYKLHGANKLPDGANKVELLALKSPALTALLAAEPEPYFLHIDKSAALATQVLKGIFAPDKQDTMEERLAAEIEHVRARRIKQAGNGVFLVLEGEADIQEPRFKARRDLEQFGLCLDDIDKPAIRESFRPAAQSVLAALGLALPPNADRRIEKIGDVVYLVDPGSGKPVYAFSLQGGHARMSVSSPLTQQSIAEAAALAPKLSADKTMLGPSACSSRRLMKRPMSCRRSLRHGPLWKSSSTPHSRPPTKRAGSRSWKTALPPPPNRFSRALRT